MGGRHALAVQAFRSAVARARELDLDYYVEWAEALLANYMIQCGEEEEGAATLRRLLKEHDNHLNLVPRLSAEAALLCHRLSCEVGNDLLEIKKLLERVREVDLPAVELRILETLARCDPDGPQGWAAAAKAILAEERYAPCNFSDAEVDALMEMLG